MREHQIVVNLKAQQFEQLQRLARERGFNSVTAYVKQKILELALGLESEHGHSDAQASAVGVGDLKRIHSELKSFLEELSTPTELPTVSLPGARTNVLDAVTAGQGFDWSPQAVNGLGADSSKVSFDLGQKPAYEVSSGSASTVDLSSSSSSSSSPNSSPNSSAVSNSGAKEPEAAPQVLPSGNLGGFGFGLGSLSSYGGSARFQTPFSSNDRLSGYRDIMDDMEELADRAFAISPRLGALDENVEDESEKSELQELSRGARKRTVEPVSDEPVNISALQSEEIGPAISSQLEPELSMEATREAAFEASLRSSLDDFLSPADDFDQTLESSSAKAEQQAIDSASSLSPAVTAISTSFVQPIVPADLPGLAELVEEETMTPSLTEDNRPQPASRRASNSPMLPPPGDLDDGKRAPTFVPPPAPLPPRVSQTNIPAMTAEISVSATSSDFGAEEQKDEDDLLSELLDGNLAAAHTAHGLRAASEPNPFAVSLSFELEATAAATGEEQTPVGQLALAEEAELEQAAEVGMESVSSAKMQEAGGSVENTTDKALDDRTTNDPVDQAANASTFSGTPPPKRRRT